MNCYNKIRPYHVLYSFPSFPRILEHVTRLDRIFMHLLEILKFKNAYSLEMRIVRKNIYKISFILIYNRSFLSKFHLVA